MVHTQAEELTAEKHMGESSAAKPLLTAEQLKAEAELVKTKGGEATGPLDAKVAEQTKDPKGGAEVMSSAPR